MVTALSESMIGVLCQTQGCAWGTGAVSDLDWVGKGGLGTSSMDAVAHHVLSYPGQSLVVVKRSGCLCI